MEYKFPTLDKDLENWYRKNNLLKTSHFIICEKPKDNNTILTSKFGGRIPLLNSSPKREFPKCLICSEYLELLVQLYIPQLPTKESFPKSLQNSLIIFLYCTECMENVEGDVIPMIYSKEELNNLIYIENPKKNQKIKENFFASFIAKELPPSEDEKSIKFQKD